MDAIFTIVAKNYIGLAQVLGDSVKNYVKADFFIIVADDFDDNPAAKENLPSNVLIAKEVLGLNEDLWNELSFKYNLIEFCTAIKPASFQYFFNQKKYKKTVFVDPDVYFFNPADSIYSLLDKYSIVLTPHILELQKEFKGDYPDYLFLSNGTFNLGFIGLSNTASTHLFLDWWHNRLCSYCFFDYEKGMATDQKWVTMIPSFFTGDELFISFHKGLNVAPWNYHERKLINNNGILEIVERESSQHPEPLVFIHFSGYNYKSFLQNKLDHKNEGASQFPDYQPAFNLYTQALQKESFSKYIDLKYSYNYFADGVNIISFNRRIYRRLLQDGIAVGNPFDVGPNSYYSKLKKQGLLDTSIVTGDKLTNKSISGFNTKIKYVHLFFTIIKKIIGIKRYSIMIRFFRRYFTEENQAFLYDKRLGEKFQ